MKEYAVYILRCSDSTLYVGMTSEIETRMSQHRLGTFKDSYTYSRRPVHCVYTANFDDVHDAISWERRIKRWGKQKKEALIESNWDRVCKYAKCMNHTYVVIGMPRKVIASKILTLFCQAELVYTEPSRSVEA